ncbi:MAG: alginate lyase family protein, partial [Candidatus Auribacterota bacterium]|nr:alginate lyase family protein [Candidatus Auribacterota bacterium]
YGFLDAGTTTPGRVAELARMIAVSAEHIEGNISYALSQKNNHPISEAMGLWTVGILFPEFKSAERWKTRGREILEECGRELIYPDGTFSQYSTNYHRLMLHDYLWVLSLAGKNGEIFSEELIDRVRAAGRFLVGIIDPATGRVPNLGTNDGALILPLTDCDYLDYRPVVQAVRVLLTGERAFPPGPWDEVLFWLGLTAPEYSAGDIEAPGSSDYFENGGYLVLRGNRSRAVIRCTSEYRHRPSHADQLHLDLWYDSTNMLRDSGTYSYNAPPDDSYFSSTGAHNTVEFDGRDQMPRLSRFLFGEWIGVKTTEPLKESAGRISWAGAYRDWRGCSHERRVELDRAGDTWTITDRVSGYMEKAVLRWRLAPELNWRLEGGCVIGDGVEIMINSDDALAGISIVDGWESLYYFEKKTIPVLEVEMPPPSAEVKTVIKFIS